MCENDKEGEKQWVRDFAYICMVLDYQPHMQIHIVLITVCDITQHITIITGDLFTGAANVNKW